MKLIKEIRSKKGELHFKRWRILSLPWFSIYIHGIYKHDMDKDLHNHPWNIWTMILKGGYKEVYWNDKLGMRIQKTRRFLNMGYRKSDEFHKIGKLTKTPTYTLAIVGKRKDKEWGYLTRKGFVDHKTYRKLK